MGVYIKGMKMPKSCDDCILTNGITCYAVPEYKEDGVVGRTDDRPNWCPLVPVPPHGRLIDADAFMRDECNSCDGACEAIPCDCVNCRSECRCEFMRDILGAETIIEAEEGAK